MAEIRVELPCSLSTLARVGREVSVVVTGEATQGALLDALETAWPVLRGTIREYGTGRRRAFIRFFAGQQDLSHRGMEARLPPAVMEGREVFMVVGAIAGG